MSTTRLSSKGQVIIPKVIRSRHNWEPGQELVATDTNDGVLLRPASAFPLTSLQEVAECLPFTGKAKTLEDMEAAIKVGAKKNA
jgi:AbrB family looped-hinge helix DNA binding protein